MPEAEYTLKAEKCYTTTGILIEAKSMFEGLIDNIRGRSERYDSIANVTATEFSELIEPSIRDVATENRSAWENSLLACVHAAGLLERYSVALEEYEGKIETYRTNLAEEVEAASTHEEKISLKEDYDAKATTAWTEFETEADECSSDLLAGPTPEGIRALTEGGFIGPAPGGLGYVITGDPEYIAFREEDLSGGTLGNDIKLAIDGNEAGADMLARDLPVLQAILALAQHRQQEGGRLDEEHMEFLAELNAALDNEYAGHERDPETGEIAVSEGDYLEVLRAIRESEHFSDEQEAEIIDALGGAVLVSSDESLGGSYENVPEPVRTTVEGPDFSGLRRGDGWGNVYGEWEEDFELVRDLLGGTSSSRDGEPLRGGAELSLNIIDTVSGNVELIDQPTVHTPEDVYRDLLSVGLRNEDASYAIMTGEYPDGADYGYPWTDDSKDNIRQRMVETLFAYDWDDDGAVAREFVDWIADDRRNGSPEEKELAGHAAAGLVDYITQEELFESLTTIGGEPFDESQPMGEVNPLATRGLLEVFEAYINDFGSGSSSSNTFDTDADTEKYPLAEDGHHLTLTPMSRVRFMELIMGDEASAAEMYESVIGTRTDSVDEMWETGTVDEEVARNNGRLTYLFESAFDNHIMGDYASGADAYQREIDVKTNAWNIAIGSASGPIPWGAGGFIGDSGKALAAAAVQNGVEIYPSHEEVSGQHEGFRPRDENTYRFDVQLQILHGMIDNGDISLGDISDSILENGELPVSTDMSSHEEPGGLTETIKEDNFSESENAMIEDHVEANQEGYEAFSEANIRATTREQYDEIINPGRRS
ncbi:hypothetical protein KIK06_18510 [Nocardiopsis sp. EMB25]|uniref:TPR repeat region-containing protein n=1 Tax=Nocardiopsis sp. EMB25 TaxID=2835867 RepID=UPI002284F791|nr:hypothetical protein [Nocardiopsis sp. EMB25]MCY9785886.1 hypothetical protein [Nocardiopsis sp. EMB25]